MTKPNKHISKHGNIEFDSKDIIAKVYDGHMVRSIPTNQKSLLAKTLSFSIGSVLALTKTSLPHFYGTRFPTE